METLIRRLAAQTLKTGTIDRRQLRAVLIYNSRHPMWRATARRDVIAIYDSVVRDAEQAMGGRIVAVA